MKRLIKKSDIQPQIGMNVQWERHPYDKSVYQIKEILPDGTVFMDNGITSYTNIKPSVLKPAE